LNEKEQNLLASDTPTGILRKMYRTMVKIRKFEEKVAELIEDGEIDHESLGLGCFHPPKTEQISTEVLSLPVYP